MVKPMTLRTRLIVSCLTCSLIPLAIVAIATYRTANDGMAMIEQAGETALEERAFAQLVALRDVKAGQVRQYFEDRRNDLQTLTDNVASANQEVYAKLEAIQILKKTQLEGFFADRVRNLETLADNPAVLDGMMGSCTQCHDSGDSDTIRDVTEADSQRHRAWLDTYRTDYGYNDLYLITHTGEVAYSSAKRSDLGEDLTEAPFKDSPLGRCFTKALERTTIEDFAPYEPAGGEPAAFMAIPLREGDMTIGVLAVDLPIESIDQIVQQRAGLGSTQETYLVGRDPDGATSYRSHRVVKKGNRVGQPKSGPNIERAFAGNSGNMVKSGSTGHVEVSRCDSLHILDLQWVMNTTGSLEEIISPTPAGRTKDFLTEFSDSHGYGDLYLLTAEGDCFYSAYHRPDHGTNLAKGKFKETNLGKLIRRVTDSKTFGFADYEEYAPNDGAQAAFVAQPVLDANGEVEVLVALQLPKDGLNTVMTSRTGMGTTGCTYLVARDLATEAIEFRSDLSFMDEEYVVGHPISAPYIDEAMKARNAEGQQIFQDSHGDGVAVAYTGIDVYGDHWGLISKIDEAEAMAAVREMNSTNTAASNRLLTWVGVLGGIAGVFVLGFGLITGHGIARPVIRATEVAEQIAQGDYTLRVDSDRKDEIGRLGGAIDGITDTMNRVLGEVNAAVEGVAGGGQQIADTSQSLAQGATEQAGSLEEIMGAMEEMAAQTHQNAENAGQANLLSGEAKTSADRGNQRMENMVESMAAINESSTNISKIIKVIDEIAFQTNLLALNAAVEAARAGTHGKGFAVVAEEVRNLAARSAKAARETTAMIEESVEKVKAGTSIAKETAEALAEILNHVSKTTDLVGEIAAASDEQAQGIGGVTDGLAQLDQVTQQNTANAEESAAASEELASQAAQLKELVSQFKLRGQTGETDGFGMPARVTSASPPKVGSPTPQKSPQPEIALDSDEFGRF